MDMLWSIFVRRTRMSFTDNLILLDDCQVSEPGSLQFILMHLACVSLFLLCSPLSVCSYGTAKSGVGVSAMSVLRPDLMMKCVMPVVLAGIIAVSHCSFVSCLFSPHSSSADLRPRGFGIDCWRA